jgi:hypothetical protein
MLSILENYLLGSSTFIALALLLRVKGDCDSSGEVSTRQKKKEILDCGGLGSYGFIIKGES